MTIKRRMFIGLLIGLIICSCDGQNNHGHDSKHAADHKFNHVNNDKMKIGKPNRISHTYEQIINGSFKQIMPLYCPVRELDWCENWDPKAVYSNSGLVEKDCVFITSHGNDDVVWIVSDYDVENGHVVMYYYVPGVLVTKLEIQLEALTEKQSKAVLTYSKTAISDIGKTALESFTKKEYDLMMDSWEKAMNHYLKTGEMLTGLPNF
ncbi:MAG: hypothetical protein MI866_18830 [Bacteroidales bacterium]|nr:hypothetical protein [Bacteroidales bacterium]